MSRIKQSSAATIIALAWLAFFAPQADAKLNVRSAILMDVTSGHILFVQNADAKIAPASLTKIMALYVALDHVKAGKAGLNDTVRVSKLAAEQKGSRMHLTAGERVTLERIIQGVAVSSGNDASVAMAEHLAGSSAAFVRLMNLKARELGMKNTTFRNPSGLPAEGQHTTARDMLTLGKYYLKNHPEALRYHGIRQITHNGALTTNKNPLFKTMPDADGLKTGWIRASGFNLVATGARNNHRLIGVVMGAPTPKAMGSESHRLMESGFNLVVGNEKIENGGARRLSL